MRQPVFHLRGGPFAQRPPRTRIAGGWRALDDSAGALCSSVIVRLSALGIVLVRWGASLKICKVRFSTVKYQRGVTTD